MDYDDITIVDPVSRFDGGLSLNFIHDRLLGAVGGFFGGGPTGALTGFFGANAGPAAAAACPPGQRRTSSGNCIRDVNACPPGQRRTSGGACVRDVNFQVDVAAILPGGDPFITGTVATGEPGSAVIGAFGMAALQPAIVGAIMDHHGEMRPVRRCPRGSVLGKDDLCYNKIPNNFRKWPRAARAPVTAQDAKCIRRAASATRRVARLAKSVGLKVKR